MEGSLRSEGVFVCPVKQRFASLFLNEKKTKPVISLSRCISIGKRYCLPTLSKCLPKQDISDEELRKPLWVCNQSFGSFWVDIFWLKCFKVQRLYWRTFSSVGKRVYKSIYYYLRKMCKNVALTVRYGFGARGLGVNRLLLNTLLSTTLSSPARGQKYAIFQPHRKNSLNLLYFYLPWRSIGIFKGTKFENEHHLITHGR